MSLKSQGTPGYSQLSLNDIEDKNIEEQTDVYFS